MSLSCAPSTIKTLPTPTISPIDAEEHSQLLEGLCNVTQIDLEGVTVLAGVNASGSLVVLCNSMAGQNVVISRN